MTLKASGTPISHTKTTLATTNNITNTMAPARHTTLLRTLLLSQYPVPMAQIVS